MKVLVYLSRQRLNPRGGPLGVGYHYYTEMVRRQDDVLEFMDDNDFYTKVHPRGRKIMKLMPQWFQKSQSIVRDVIHTKRFLDGKDQATATDFSKYDIIHFHETTDLVHELENLKDYKGKVILQSHSPLPKGMEYTTDLPGIYRFFIPNIEERYSEVDKKAFMRADYLIFPCEEAEEPYMENWKEYKEIKEAKKNCYRYVLTGIGDVSPKRDRNQVREELHFTDEDFIVCYAGRHNTVKGYDILKSIGKEFLPQAENNHFLVCGREGPLETAQFKRWKEIGWTNDAYSYIGASDVFVLPNRVTYFDLIMIEVLALGKIVIASRTGGNKYFEKNNVPGIFLYDSPEEAVRLLNMVKEMPEEQRKLLGEQNRKFYQEKLTVAAMYDAYMNVLHEIAQA